MRLWRNQDGTRTNKYLVQRRDGTVPEWPYLVIAAADPAAPAALRAYAEAARAQSMGDDYADDIVALADEFDAWRKAHHEGDPSAPPHRTDDPAVVARIP